MSNFNFIRCSQMRIMSNLMMKRSAELGKFLNPPAHYLSMNCLPIIHFNVVKEDVKQAFLN